jgi:serine/threonine-protein kinase PRP4
MLRKGAFAMAHFNRDLNFQATDKDTGMNNGVPRLMFNIKPKGIGSYISNVPGEDPKTVSSFKDLLDKIFFLEPAKRLTVEQALLHPFITGK